MGSAIEGIKSVASSRPLLEAQVPVRPGELGALAQGAQGGDVPAVSRPASRPPRRGRWLIVAAGVVAVAAAGVFAWRYLVPRPAETMAVQPGAFVRELRGPGTLDAIRKARVSASMQGVLTTVRVDIGDRVRAGDVIAVLEAEDLRAQRDAAVASHDAAVKAVLLARADRRKAEAGRANARLALDRKRQLMRSGAAAQSALDAAQMTHEQALADLARTEAAISQVEAAEVAAAASASAGAAQLEKSVIRAPMDGVVVARKLNVGDLVVPGSAIVELADPASVVLSARFDESIISAVAPGQAARLLFSDAADGGIRGTVRRIGREVDTETREFVVDIAPRALPRNWAIGQRGTAVLSLGGRDQVLAVPVAALAARAAARGVFVLRDGRAWWQPVETGALGAAQVEVRRGLAAGDVILARPGNAYPGMRVGPGSGAR